MRFSSTSLFVSTLVARHGICNGLGRFSYKEDDDLGPSKWDEVSSKDNEWQEWKDLKVDKNECRNKDKRQSPVDLSQNIDCQADHEMLFEDHECKFDDIIFEITPYSLKGRFPYKMCDPPSLDLSDSFHERYVNTFEIKVPGEHMIEGKSFDAELQFSHVINVKKEFKDDRTNLVAIAARMIDSTKEKTDKYIERFLIEWEAVAEDREEECENLGRGMRNPLETLAKKVQRKERRKVRKLQKERLDVGAIKEHVLKEPFMNQYYYGYKGTLTVPPCSEIVRWFVMDKPMSITKSQLGRLRKLVKNYLNKDCKRGTYANEKGDVNRPIQDKTGGRKDHTIFHCDESD